MKAAFLPVIDTTSGDRVSSVKQEETLPEAEAFPSVIDPSMTSGDRVFSVKQKQEDTLPEAEAFPSVIDSTSISVEDTLPRHSKKSQRKKPSRRKNNKSRNCDVIIVPDSFMFPEHYGSTDMDPSQPDTLNYFPVRDLEKETELDWPRDWKPRFDDRDASLLEGARSWDLKVLKVLHMIRRKELFQYNSKLRLFLPTRFCDFNIALFDLDKESEVEPGPLYSQIPASRYQKFDYSINVISIKVTESDVPYPIKVYGTVLARDHNDYRCVYLFKRGRDDPQLITEMDDTLTLTGPYRAICSLDSMYFEFHLKILGDGVIDQDFSKGLIERNACCDTGESRTRSLTSCLSTIDMLYTPVPSAVQARIEVNILNGKSTFIGKITASAGADKNKIILYDSKVAGTELNIGSGGSVSLTRSVVSVKHNEKLVLKIYVSDDDGASERLKMDLGHSDEGFIRKLGSYELQVKIIWMVCSDRNGLIHGLKSKTLYC